MASDVNGSPDARPPGDPLPAVARNPHAGTYTGFRDQRERSPRCWEGRGTARSGARYPVTAPTNALRSGFVEGPDVGPRPDLVDHHRRHRDGVPARPRPLRLKLLGHGPNLLEEVGGLGDELVDLGDEHVAYRGIWHGADTSVSRPRAVAAAPGALVLRADTMDPECS
jgi:hypothetical protein